LLAGWVHPCWPPFCQVVKTWSTKNNKRDKQGKLLKHLRTVFSTRMMLAWLAWALLLW
jgi:hypothetical protein